MKEGEKMEELSSIKYLEEKQIPFEVREFPESTEKSLENIAKILSLRPIQVVKTLIVKGKSGKFYICLIGGNQELHHKKLKKETNEKDIMMAPIDEIYMQTGYHVGAIPPFGLKNKLDTYIEESLKSEEILSVGTGKWGFEILLTTDDLQKATEGKFVKIIK